MKKLFYLLTLAVLISQCTPKTVDNSGDGSVGNLKIGTSPDTELDRSKAPVPGPAPKIKMGSYESIKLDNGMEVIVVKNSKIPRVSFQYALNIDPVLEGENAGLQSIVGDMLRRGTKNRTKQEIDKEVDFIGATLNTSSSGIYASSLTKHSDKIIELMADVLLNPTFPDEELEKMKTQMISNLASAKNDPNAIAGNVADVLRFGKEHPYGEIMTEETVNNITSEKIREFYKTYFKPNAGYLVVVGDIDVKEAQTKLNQYFSNWKGAEVPTTTYETPEAPKGTNVAFVDRPGAVQSVITVTYPVDLQPGSNDAIAASVANGILGGGGFSGRLMQNLREDKGYTYGARSALRTDPLVGYFSASASVRNEVTDSAITEFLYEIDRMAREKVSVEDLQKTKNIMAGSFARALERPETVASFALNTARYNLPADYYEKYLENLAAVTADDVLRVSKKYLSKDKAHVLVVGNKDQVASKISTFASDKKVDFYDNYGNPVKEAGALPEGLTAEKVIEKYISAIGGKQAVSEIEDITTITEISVMGQKLTGTMKQFYPNRFRMTISMGPQVVQEQIYDGEQGLVVMMGNKQGVKGKEAAAMAEQAQLFPELRYDELGYELELKSIEAIEGKDAYKIIITSETGNSTTEYFDVATGLKVRSISSISGPQGEVTTTTDLSDYKEINGVKFPHAMKQNAAGQNFEMKVSGIEINTGLTVDDFKLTD